MTDFMASSEETIKEMEVNFSAYVAYRCSICLELAEEGHIKLTVSLSDSDKQVIVVVCEDCNSAFYSNKDYLDISWTFATITISDVKTFGNLKSRKATNFSRVQEEAWANFEQNSCVFYNSITPEL